MEKEESQKIEGWTAEPGIVTFMKEVGSRDVRVSESEQGSSFGFELGFNIFYFGLGLFLIWTWALDDLMMG